jgi:tRNA dimethylallyltransferase
MVRASASEGPSVRVKVLSVPPPDASVKSKLDAMEAKRADAEAQMLDQAIEEMGSLADVVVNELKASLQLQMSTLLIPVAPETRAAVFLKVTERDVPGMPAPEGLPQQLNVRVGGSDIPYPTISGLAQDMETRRDTAEHLLRKKILELELKLLEATNKFAKDALHRAVGSVLVRLLI